MNCPECNHEMIFDFVDSMKVFEGKTISYEEVWDCPECGSAWRREVILDANDNSGTNFGPFKRYFIG